MKKGHHFHTTQSESFGFLAGSRVAYQGAAPGIRRGRQGTIVGLDPGTGLSGGIIVLFDDEEGEFSVAPENLRLVVK